MWDTFHGLSIPHEDGLVAEAREEQFGNPIYGTQYGFICSNLGGMIIFATRACALWDGHATVELVEMRTNWPEHFKNKK